MILSEGKLIILWQVVDDPDEINNFFMNNYWNNRELREAHEKSLNEMEELKRFQGSTFDTFSMRKLVEDRDTILELTTKIQELLNEVNYMNDSRDFKRCRVSTQWTIPVNQRYFHLIVILAEC